MGKLTIDMLKKFREKVSKNKFDPFKEKEVFVMLPKSKTDMVITMQLCLVFGVGFDDAKCIFQQMVADIKGFGINKEKDNE